MNRKQKIILGIFALADLLAIAFMGGYILLTTSRQRQEAPSTAGEAVETCTDDILRVFSTAFNGAEDEVVVGWERTHAHIRVSISTSGIGDVEPTPQLLWIALDALATQLPETCSTPETITVSISVLSPSSPSDGDASSGITRYVAQVEGKYLYAWHQGIIDDETLAGLARYRAETSAHAEP